MIQWFNELSMFLQFIWRLILVTWLFCDCSFCSVFLSFVLLNVLFSFKHRFWFDSCVFLFSDVSINFNPLMRPFLRPTEGRRKIESESEQNREREREPEWLWVFFTFSFSDWVTERNDDVHNCFCFALYTQLIQFVSIRLTTIPNVHYIYTHTNTHTRTMDSCWW